MLFQFFYLSSMFWLNSMCVDVWRTFRQLRSFKAANSAGGGGGGVWRHPKYRWYALWSWGGPATVVAVTLAMQYLPQTITLGNRIIYITYVMYWGIARPQRNEMCIGKLSCRASVFLPSSDLSL